MKNLPLLKIIIQKTKSFNLKEKSQLANYIIVILCSLLINKNGIAQSYSLSTTAAIPDSSAALDIISSDKGLLIPRVSLLSVTDSATIGHPAISLQVYNVNASMTGGGKGFWYWNGTQWIRNISSVGADSLVVGSSTSSHLYNLQVTGTAGATTSLSTPTIIGGSGTTSSLTYKTTTGVGTSGADHIFKVGSNGGTEAMRILNSGDVGIGTDIPYAKLHTTSTTEQLRLAYDGSNYYSTIVGSAGGITFDATGSSPDFIFNDPVTLADNSVTTTQILNDSTTKIATTAFVDRALEGVSGGSGWGLTGNSGTSGGTHFIGTTDNNPFNIRVNNLNAGKIDPILNRTFYGYLAGYSDTTGNNIAIGTGALYSNTSGIYNIAIGNGSIASNTTGYLNTACGMNALGANTTGNRNTANGYQALSINSSGYNNTAVGCQALQNTTSGPYNVGVGASALFYNTTGGSNIATGVTSLYYNTTGVANVAYGEVALYNNITGVLNTGIGSSAGYSRTTGNNNSYLGAGTDGVDSVNNSTAIGANAFVNAGNKIRIGDANITVIEGQVAFTNVSDGRFKKNVKETDIKGLDFIIRLRPVSYNIDTKQFEEFLTKKMSVQAREKHFKDRDFKASSSIRHNGFIAQEVETAAKAANYEFSGIHRPESDNDNYGIAYSEFVVPLVKAVQEQQQLIKDQQQVNQDQQKTIDKLTQRIQLLEAHKQQ